MINVAKEIPKRLKVIFNDRSIHSALNEYHDYLKSKSLSKNTIRNYLHDLVEYFIFCKNYLRYGCLWFGKLDQLDAQLREQSNSRALQPVSMLIDTVKSLRLIILHCNCTVSIYWGQLSGSKIRFPDLRVCARCIQTWHCNASHLAV